MKITFIPQRRDDTLSLERKGETLILDGIRIDLAGLPEAGRMTPQEAGSCWLAGDIHRRDGRIEIALFLPLAANAPKECRFPEPVLISQDGPVALPQGVSNPAETHPDL